ncbi:hypothetical protein BJX70DRAFT_76504 [Aspergillus crustosus]
MATDPVRTNLPNHLNDALTKHLCRYPSLPISDEGDQGQVVDLEPANNTEATRESNTEARAEESNLQLLNSETFQRSLPPSFIDLTNEDSSNETPEQKLDESFNVPRLTHAPIPIDIVIENLKGIVTGDHYSQKKGQVYILSDPVGTITSFKISNSMKVSKRLLQHRRQCGLESWNLQIQPSVEIKQCSRLERLAQAELKNLNCEPRCACQTRHVEHYCGSTKSGLEVLKGWSKWFMEYQPYNDDNRLGEFWIDRLELFRTNIPRYFNCDADRCPQ